MLTPLAQFLIGAAVSAAVAVTVTPAARSQALNDFEDGDWVIMVPVHGGAPHPHTSPSAFLLPFDTRDECEEFLASEDWAKVWENFTKYEISMHPPASPADLGTPACAQVKSLKPYPASGKPA